MEKGGRICGNVNNVKKTLPYTTGSEDKRGHESRDARSL